MGTVWLMEQFSESDQVLGTLVRADMVTQIGRKRADNIVVRLSTGAEVSLLWPVDKEPPLEAHRHLLLLPAIRAAEKRYPDQDSIVYATVCNGGWLWEIAGLEEFLNRFRS